MCRYLLACHLLFVTFSWIITLELEICPVSGCRIREGTFPQAVGALVCGTRGSWESSRMNADPSKIPCSWLQVTFLVV